MAGGQFHYDLRSCCGKKQKSPPYLTYQKQQGFIRYASTWMSVKNRSLPEHMNVIRNRQAISRFRFLSPPVSTVRR
jgi:hypothetical protein